MENPAIQPPVALENAKNWLRTLTNGKLSEWYKQVLIPLIEPTGDRSTLLYLERKANQLQKNLATIEDKPYQHPYYWAAFTITGKG